MNSSRKEKAYFNAPFSEVSVHNLSRLFSDIVDEIAVSSEAYCRAMLLISRPGRKIKTEERLEPPQ